MERLEAYITHGKAGSLYRYMERLEAYIDTWKGWKPILLIETGIVENCHLKSQILPQLSPNFATKIEKFATFCQKNYQILQIKLNSRKSFFLFPETRNITLTQRCTQKVTQVHIRKKKD